MMMKCQSSNEKKPVPNDRGFTDIVLSWSLEQIENQDLFKDMVCLCFFFSLIKQNILFLL
jgi:hypothetical protein